MTEPISQDKSTLYGGRGRQRTKNTEIVLFVPTLSATIEAPISLHSNLQFHYHFPVESQHIILFLSEVTLILIDSKVKTGSTVKIKVAKQWQEMDLLGNMPTSS